MTPDVLRHVPEVGSATGLPAPADVADTWLAHALSQLFDAYRLPEETRRRLVVSGCYPGEVGEPVPEAAGDTSRLAVEFAALALEARLNRILETCDPADWSAVAHLAPVEKLRVAPRLLGHPEPPTEYEALHDAAVELFELRDELVDGGATTADALETQAFSPGSARRMVEASAAICSILPTLAGRDDSGLAEHARRAAHALAQHPARIAASDDWSDFPPDVIGS